MQPEQVPGYFAHWGEKVDHFLKKVLPSPRTRPTLLHEAMHYSLFNGGKRLRPILAIAAAEAAGSTPSRALPVAAAVECIHAYSLIHDDLPCMDNDDLRRGRPTCHKAFGEAVALLAGDALLTQAFAIIALAPAGLYSIGDYVARLAEAAGSRHLIGGQVADMLAENQEIQPADLRFIHQGKTAAMISVSLRLGAMSAEASPDVVEKLAHFGRRLGLAFQVIDDILDVTQPSEILGKSAGKDITAGKATYPAMMGIEGARREASRLTRKAVAELDSMEERGENLRAIARYMLQRTF